MDLRTIKNPTVPKITSFLSKYFIFLNMKDTSTEGHESLPYEYLYTTNITMKD